MAKDYYQVLGLTKAATHADIKVAFKKLARTYHPDLNPGQKEAEDKFKAISEAYEVLGDEKKRKQYDMRGSFNFGNHGPRNPYTQNYWQSMDFNEIDLEDIFGDVFGFGGGKCGRRVNSNFDFGNLNSNRSRKGSDINWALPLDLISAVNGCEKQLLLSDGNKIKVKIPAGMDEGSKIRLAGKGNPGIGGGAAGDLIIEIKLQPHASFKKEGNDIHHELEISLMQALQGAKVTVPTVHGNVELKIPAESQSGQQLRLKGKGIQNQRGGESGNQYIHLLVKYPKDLSAKQKEEILKILNEHAMAERG